MRHMADGDDTFLYPCLKQKFALYSLVADKSAYHNSALRSDLKNSLEHRIGSGQRAHHSI